VGQGVALLVQQIPVVGDAQFLKSCFQGRAGLLFQRSGAVAGNQSVKMVIRAIHKDTSYFFVPKQGVNFPAERFCTK
jgi:hypothetical protein